MKPPITALTTSLVFALSKGSEAADAGKEAPARFQWLATERLVLSEGRASAEVSKAAAGFTIETPGAELKDLGTRFGVEVSPQGESQLHVFEGEVLARPGPRRKKKPATAPPLGVRQGEAVVIAQGGEVSEGRVRGSAFVAPAEVRALDTAWQAGQRRNWQTWSSLIRRDGALVLYSSFAATSVDRGPPVAKGLKNNVKIAIAATYASGHILSPPDFYDWVSPHYYGNMADDGPYYRFIREHPELFDEYQTLPQVGVLYNSDPLVSSNANHDTAFAADKTFISDFNEIASRLINNYFSVGVVCAGDGTFVTKEFTEEDISTEFEYFVVPRNTALHGNQAAIVDKLQSQGNVYSWTGDGQKNVNELKRRIAPWISCSGPQVNDIWAMPRTRNPLAKESDPDLILHLVNGKHSTNTDVVTPNRNITLEIREELLAGRTLQRILCYEVPDREPHALSYAKTAAGIKIVVPTLDIWSIIKFEFEGPTEDVRVDHDNVER